MNTYLLSKLQQEIELKLEEGSATTADLMEMEKNTALLTAEMTTLLEMTEATAEALKNKAKEYAEKAKVMAEKCAKLEKKIIEVICDYGTGNEINYNGLKFKVKVNPPKVDVEDEDLVPIEYKKGTIKLSAKDCEKVKILLNKPELEVKYEIDKKAIKETEKTGVSVAGTKIIQELSLKR